MNSEMLITFIAIGGILGSIVFSHLYVVTHRKMLDWKAKADLYGEAMEKLYEERGGLRPYS